MAGQSITDDSKRGVRDYVYRSQNKNVLTTHHNPSGSVKILGLRPRSQVGHWWCYLGMVDPKNTFTRYEHCNLYRSDISSKVKVCGQTNRQRERWTDKTLSNIPPSYDLGASFWRYKAYLLMMQSLLSMCLLIRSFLTYKQQEYPKRMLNSCKLWLTWMFQYAEYDNYFYCNNDTHVTRPWLVFFEI